MGTMKQDLIVVKLGGSLITHKDRPHSPNGYAIQTAASAIANVIKSGFTDRLFLIHGGGSFGHYYATKFHLSTKPKRISNLGVSKVAAAMMSLHSMILDRLVKEGVPCATIVTSELMSAENKISEQGLDRLETLFRGGLIPLSFGNVMTTKKGSMIVSGDSIALALARRLTVERVIFAMDVDGIFPDSDMKAEIVKELTPRRFVIGNRRKYDVTGGVDSKIKIGFRLAELGANVFYMNGKKKQRLESLIMGIQGVKSTQIPRNSEQSGIKQF